MLELLIANKKTGGMWNVINATESVQLETHRTGSPSKLTFKWIKTSEEVSFLEGDIVRFSVDGQVQFYGWVFTKTKDRWNVFDVVCYDRIRYLKNSGSYAFYNMSAGDILTQIAEDFQVGIGEVADTGYKIPSLIESNKPCIDIIQDALNQTLLNTGKVFCLYDNGTGLSLKYVGDWKSNVVIGDRSYLTDYTYKTDIDSDTYNSVKVVMANQQTGVNEVVVAQDSANIAKWGMLQLYQTLNGDYNTAQMSVQATQTLNAFNRRHRYLTFESLGVLGLRAGMMVRMYIPGMGDIDLDQYVLLDRVTHTWTNGEHMMECEAVDFDV